MVDGVHLWVAVAAGAGFGGISYGLFRVAMRARWNKIRVGAAAMVAERGVVIGGKVEVRGELWMARGVAGDLVEGDVVRVIGVDGMVLVVERV